MLPVRRAPLAHAAALGLLAFGAIALASDPAAAQTQIRPRVLIMVDTSGSMTWHFMDNASAGGDGSTLYTDGVMTRGLTQTPGFGLYPGFLLSGSCNAPPTVLSAFDGINSRMFAAKAAVANVVNGSGDIDWGLMRYTGTQCPVLNTFTRTTCNRNTNCGSGSCTNNTCDCTSDFQCRYAEFCVGGKCGTNNNLCSDYPYYDQACITRNGNELTYSGDCGTSQNAGTAKCATQQVCYADADCSGAKAGQCALIPGSSASSCQCGGNFAACPTGYTCTAGRCVYANGCQAPGGVILIDPSSANSNAQILPWVDGVEALSGNLLGLPVNPELRAVSGTPLAGAARSATDWYNNIKTNNLDPKIACRPYVLVQMTDGFDSCDGDTTNGPVAAAQGFVAATAPGAKNLNKVYVVGLAFGNVPSPALDAIAKAGGTGTARLANSQADIQAALADIVASSVLIEKCNNADDDCNAVCDDSFPDVALTNANGCTPRAAKTCDNGALKGTRCYATGVYVCSNDQLSETCSAKTCAQDASLCPTAEAATGCNGVDDDCNGVIDDCTAFVQGSCCQNKCPACNLAGTPQPETCNGCDDDCDGIVDNKLTDTGRSCGSNIGMCEYGTSFCCQEVNPSVGSCTQSQVGVQAQNPDRIVCLGGRGPGTETCNGVDDNCNGVADEVSQSCYPFGQGTPGVGICRAGVAQCGAVACGTQPNACCAALTPPISTGKPCAGAAAWAACSGAVGPRAETCNGLDDDCNAQTDDAVTDAWLNMACCPTGNLADCANANGANRCKTGVFACVAGARACAGAIAKAAETCNAIDDDCNGAVDDVPGLGGACSGNGFLNVGACKALYTCTGVAGPGPNGLTCTQTVGPKAETCNGADDDCDGTVDNNPSDVGQACGTLCPGGLVANCRGQCKAGAFVCTNGVRSCAGNTGPAAEVCDGLDNDCDGAVDNNLTDAWAGQACCQTGNLADCTNANGANRCKAGAFACVGGARACSGSIARGPETCNAVDDDCNGKVDDVAGAGTACAANGVNTKGTCTALWTCAAQPGSGPNGLTCVQVQGPKNEVCNGLDDDCDGIVDNNLTDVGMVCADLCPGMQPGNCVGQCKAGKVACVNGAKLCQGAEGPSAEVCDGVDNDCNGQIDDKISDAWVGAACCPTGNLADCTNAGGAMRCMPGAFRCTNGQRACNGAVAKSAETCNGADDDCNGLVDDVSGIGLGCTGNGINTQGACTAAFACTGMPGPGPNGLTCQQKVGPMAEICNGIDDNCNGLVDENAVDVGVPCGDKCPGGMLANCVGICAPGATACANGQKKCVGGVGPALEVCNGLDDNCNGAVDDVPGVGQACSGQGLVTQGACMAAYACVGGMAGPGPNGLTCTQSRGPMIEVCNGIDDDCNGVVDDNPTDVGMPCGDACPGGLIANCVGACMPGMSICANGAKVCSGSVGPSPEVCDSVDNDCNGQVDDKLTDPWLNMACCPSGNLGDCTNAGGGMRCKAGSYQCQMGGRVCAGGVQRMPELCNGDDDDCNGLVDDVPGIGQPCFDVGVKTQGICNAAFACTGMAGPGPNGLTCAQKTGPQPELCNGVDDDCDGIPDNNLKDPRVGVPGGLPCMALQPGADQPPCDPGTTACKNGAIVCSGQVLPMPNVCDKPPTDCSGNPNHMGTCPMGLSCFDGQCLRPCGGGEFPCPGGYLCDKNNNCIPDVCAKFPCPFGFYCDLDQQGMPYCHDRCMGIDCGAGRRCVNGQCLDDTCRSKGCPMGQACLGNPPMCVNDPCAGVTCQPGEYCDQSNGKCVPPCSMCKDNERCSLGQCVPNPCYGKECPGGQGCAVVDNQAVCIDKQCDRFLHMCNPGTVCCGPLCIVDPCKSVVCGKDQACALNTDCTPACVDKDRDKVVAAGGGGFACDVGERRGGGHGAALVAIGLLAIGLLRRRWLQRGPRGVTAVAIVALAGLASGCNPNPFCLNCNDDVDLLRLPDFARPVEDLAGTEVDLTMSNVDDGGACVPTNNGVEICDGVDNDCNGKLDDVSADRLARDPSNCGRCGNVCDFTMTHQFGQCAGGGDGGVPSCAPDTCVPGYYDADGDPKNGCEYACSPSNPPVEVCDGKDNDCNGKIDEGFGFPSYATDAQNCGACGGVCNLPGAVATCVADPMTGKGICVVDHCINDGKNTFRHPGYMPGVLNRTGCEYHCVKPSSTPTMGSDDCDKVKCAFDPETCNGLDDDCDFRVDNAAIDVGLPCGAACPGGDVKGCIGACKAGTTACVAGVLACQGSTGPQPELCNGADDDCDGAADDNVTDPWLAQACCPSGNLADCTNTKTGNLMGTRCMAGAFVCAAGKRACMGGVMKTLETCNGSDDNCNGAVDDVPGIGGACSAQGVNTQGACTAAWACTGMPGPGPLGLSCQQAIGPAAEACNGVDDDCNGVVDDNPADVGQPCGANCPGGLVKNCVGACRPGATICTNGSPVCDGSVGGSQEICDGKDNDCNGQIDDVAGIGTACAGNGVLTQGICTAKYVCTGQAGPGPSGLTCQQVVGPKAETCNGADDDCNGAVDDNAQGVGQTCAAACPGGLLANCKGECRAGVQQCTGGAIVCAGSVGPTLETCNLKDDDCDGVVDNNLTDAWAGQGCCPTGNNGDCTNSGGGNRCALGAFQCAAGAKVCQGGVARTPETCNLVDDDCNGQVDDVPGAGLACVGGGTNTQGTCTAAWVCTGMAGPGPNGLTCTQKVGPAPEKCNGVDDNCNGLVDDGPTDVGAACGDACPGGLVGNCVGQCKAGLTSCQNGAKVCNGSVGPAVETCNGLDDDCDGVADNKLTDGWVGAACCLTGNLADCQNTGNGVRCRTGTYACQAGARVCNGAVQKDPETCNNVDDDCNGATDDIAGIGSPCTGGGVNTKGACTAVYACIGVPGPGPNGLTCAQKLGPGVETCNGVDDDCDGVVDDNLTDVGQACAINCPGGNLAGCVGECKAGVIACAGGVRSCSGSTGPSAEICDGKDNDCDGTIDNGFGYPLYNTDVKNCGRCGGSCGLANAVNGCHTDMALDGTGKGVCYVVACNNTAQSGFSYVPNPCGGTTPPRDGPNGVGCNYACPVWPTTPETCDGKDNNCNNRIDELKDNCAADGLVAPANFCATQGVCGGQNVPVVCNGAGGWKCNYAGITGIELDANGNLLLSEKLCDVKDGNCNGVVDLDGFPTLGNACSAGVGACQTTGTIVCKNNTTAGCSAAANPNAATDERCDGLDNNCNGLVDERTNYTDPNSGKTTKGWIDSMVGVPKQGGGTVWVYWYEASRPGATNGNAGANTTRACSVSGVLPWGTVTQTQAAAACAAIKDSVGAPMRLCTAAEWKVACEGPGGAAASKWSLSKNPTTYVAQICNDVNYQMNPAIWPTGTASTTATQMANYCYTDWPGAAPAGRAYDMSGNMGEWTSTPVVSGGITYYQVLGGNLTSPQGGDTCEFTFDIAKPTFANYNLGFRCCADNAP